jgi:hypothetical protein
VSRFFRFTAMKTVLCLTVALSSTGAIGIATTAASANAATNPSTKYPPVDHQLCYKATVTPGTSGFNIPTTGVTLINQFSPNGFAPQIGSLFKNCNPVQKTITSSSGTKTVTPITNPAAHLACFHITAPTQSTFEVQVTNQFGTARLDTGQPQALCLPTWKSLTGPPDESTPQPAGLNHFTCYPITYAAGSTHYAPTGAVSLQDEFANSPVNVKVGGPKLLCLPTEKIIQEASGGTVTYPIVNPNKHLLCFKVSETPFPPNVFDQNQFGSAEVNITGTNLLCLPSTKKIISTTKG